MQLVAIRRDGGLHVFAVVRRRNTCRQRWPKDHALSSAPGGVFVNAEMGTFVGAWGENSAVYERARDRHPRK